VRVWNGFIWLRIESNLVKTSNEPSGFIKGEEFLDQLRSDYQLLKY
jgi:hypothetical protein